MTHIASSVPGRIRLLDTALHDPAVLTRLAAALDALEGVASTRGNAAAGSVVVHYERRRITPRQIEQAVAGTLGSPRTAPEASIRRRVNRYAKIGALATLATSLVLAAAGRKSAHTLAGCAFLACLAVHILLHRRSLTR